MYNAVADPHGKRLIAVIGPTGAGKSELGIRIAEVLDGEIVNCDSLQIYKGFNIGTAKLTAPARRGIPHHLLDIAEPDETFTAGEFARLARASVNEIAERGRVPILVGGTGFYLRAFLDGLPPLPSRSTTLRARLAGREQKRPGSLYRLLRRLDPDAGLRMHERDLPKIMRALEVRILTGHGQSGQLPAVPLAGFHIRKLGLFPPRAALYHLLNRRAEWMFGNGLLSEVEDLLARGVSPSAKPFESLGYRQALAVIKGEMTVPEAIADTQQATRRYAKRQITWFRHEPGVEHIAAFGPDVNPLQWIEWQQVKSG